MVVRFKDLTAGFTAAVIPAVADADKDGNSNNPADQSDGQVVKTSCASLYINSNRGRGAMTALGVCLLL